jgi:hypothetical protein
LSIHFGIHGGHAQKINIDQFLLALFLSEALNKGLSLSLDSGRIRLCEAPCGADAALFRDSFRFSFSIGTALSGLSACGTNGGAKEDSPSPLRRFLVRFTPMFPEPFPPKPARFEDTVTRSALARTSDTSLRFEGGRRGPQGELATEKGTVPEEGHAVPPQGRRTGQGIGDGASGRMPRWSATWSAAPRGGAGRRSCSRVCEWLRSSGKAPRSVILPDARLVGEPFPRDRPRGPRT